MRKHTVRCTAKNSVKLEIDDNIATDVVADNIQGAPFASVNYVFEFDYYTQRRLLPFGRNTKYFPFIENYYYSVTFQM